MGRLFFLVVGVEMNTELEAVEGEHAVGLGVPDAWALVGRLQGVWSAALRWMVQGGDFTPSLGSSHCSMPVATEAT